MGTPSITKSFAKLNMENYRDINILLLGETGVGKSTFINSFANYVQHKQFNVAEKEQLLVLIPSYITVLDKDFDSHILRIGADDNELQEVGMSATQDVKSYVFPLGSGNTRLRLIDTPGMGDSRGIDQDDINCDNILINIGKLQELHAICFLLKPTTSRLTPSFQYCIKQFFSRLDKSAVDNLVFVFTNTRGTNYTPGETMSCMQRFIDGAKVHIPFLYTSHKRNIFCFDNEAFRYLVALKNNVKLDEDAKKSCIVSWKNASKESERLISYIIGDGASHDPLMPHQIRNTVCINEARRLITQLARPLGEITQLIYDNIRILQRHHHNLTYDNQSLNELKKNLYMPVINLKVIHLTQPVTVCTSDKCASVYKVADATKWHYKQRCHDPCYLTNIRNECIGDPGLIHCAAMGGTSSCKECACDFSIHMHVYYMTETVEENIEDDSVKKNILSKERALVEVQKLIDQIDKRKQELEEERDVIVKTTAQFAHFLENNAITPFNDSYKTYIAYLIIREKSLGTAADEGNIKHLEKLMNEYEEIKMMFDRSLKYRDKLGSDAINEVTAKTIQDGIALLYNLKHNGEKIHELYNTQIIAREKEYEQSEYVHKNVTVGNSAKGNDKKTAADKGATKPKSQAQQKTQKNKDHLNTQRNDQRGYQRNDQRGYQRNDQRGYQKNDYSGYQKNDYSGYQKNAPRNGNPPPYTETSYPYPPHPQYGRPPQGPPGPFSYYSPPPPPQPLFSHPPYPPYYLSYPYPSAMANSDRSPLVSHEEAPSGNQIKLEVHLPYQNSPDNYANLNQRSYSGGPSSNQSTKSPQSGRRGGGRGRGVGHYTNTERRGRSKSSEPTQMRRDQSKSSLASKTGEKNDQCIFM